MHTLKLTPIGDSFGIVLPQEMLAKLMLHKDDTLFLSDTPEGLLLTPYDPAIADQIKAGREFMREYRNAFAALNK